MREAVALKPVPLRTAVAPFTVTPVTFVVESSVPATAIVVPLVRVPSLGDVMVTTGTVESRITDTEAVAS